MKSWKLISKETIAVPVRSSGNNILTIPIEFDVYKDGAEFKAVPHCDEEQKRLANLKEEIHFIFRPDKAVSTAGILDGNQHIIESIGTKMRDKGLD